MALTLLMLNMDFYRFLKKQQGLAFTLKAIPMHWFGYAYSGIGLLIGVLSFLARSGREPGQPSGGGTSQ